MVVVVSFLFVMNKKKKKKKKNHSYGPKKKKSRDLRDPLVSEHAKKRHVERRWKLSSPCNLTISPLVERALGVINPKSYYHANFQVELTFWLKNIHTYIHTLHTYITYIHYIHTLHTCMHTYIQPQRNFFQKDFYIH